MKVTAAEAMVPIGEFPAVPEDEYIHRAAEILVQWYARKEGTWRGFEILLVRNKNGQEVGILTVRSILKAISREKELKVLIPRHLFPKPGKIAPTVVVKDIMRPINNCCVDIYDSIDRAVMAIMENNINSVLVRHRGKPVGIIRTIDLFWFAEYMI